MESRETGRRRSYEHFEAAVNWLDSNRSQILQMAEQYEESHPDVTRKLHLADYLRSALHARLESLASNRTPSDNMREFLHPAWEEEFSRLKRQRRENRLHIHGAAYDHIAERLKAGETAEQIITPRFKPLELRWLKASATDGLKITGFGSLQAYFRLVFGISIPDYPLNQVQNDFEIGQKRNPRPVRKEKREKPEKKSTPPPKPLISLPPGGEIPIVQKSLRKPVPSTTPKVEALNPLTALEGLPKRVYRGIRGTIDLAADVVELAMAKREPRLLDLEFWKNHFRLAPVHEDIKNHEVKGQPYAGHGSWREFLRVKVKCPKELLPKE